MSGLPYSGAMQSLVRSLRALGHPLSLASVALLVANDHLLKRAYPSVLTGKLSDFAGLFFFPFLLTALFGLAGHALVRRPFAAGDRRRADAWTHPVPGYGAYLLTALLALIPSYRLWSSSAARPGPGGLRCASAASQDPLRPRPGARMLPGRRPRAARKLR